MELVAFHGGGHDRPRPGARCYLCRGPVELTVVEMTLATNRGWRFPRVVVEWCAACQQTNAVELAEPPAQCRCESHLETDLADHGAVPSAQQLVSVIFESCSACGQVREAYLNH